MESDVKISSRTLRTVLGHWKDKHVRFSKMWLGAKTPRASVHARVQITKRNILIVQLMKLKRQQYEAAVYDAGVRSVA